MASYLSNSASEVSFVNMMSEVLVSCQHMMWIVLLKVIQSSASVADLYFLLIFWLSIVRVDSGVLRLGLWICGGGGLLRVVSPAGLLVVSRLVLRSKCGLGSCIRGVMWRGIPAYLVIAVSILCILLVLLLAVVSSSPRLVFLGVVLGSLLSFLVHGDGYCCIVLSFLLGKLSLSPSFFLFLGLGMRVVGL